MEDMISFSLAHLYIYIYKTVFAEARNKNKKPHKTSKVSQES